MVDFRHEGFHLYDGQHPVAVEEPIMGGNVRIRYIEREVGPDGDISDEDRMEIVPAEKLEPLTPALAKLCLNSLDKIVRKCNIRKHAFNECLRYM